LSSISAENSGRLEGTNLVHGKVSIGQGSRVKNSILRGPISIKNNCLIEECEIGPFTSIAQDVIISKSRLERCIILDRCRISGIDGRLVRSLIGKGCIIEMHSRGEATELFLGDDCRLSI
ncbi:MAG: glucose-1-phosphate thymidylyltransferase, partial [Bacillota bacterium]